MLNITSMPRRMRACFFLGKIKSGDLRGITASAVFTIMMIDFCAYWVVWQAIRVGLMPPYVADILIASLAFLEAWITLAWAVLWPTRRRRVVMLCTLVSGLTAVLLLFVPQQDIGNGSEYCSATAGVRGDSSQLVIQLCILAVVAAVSILCRAGVWCHGILLFDEHKPKYSTLNYGVIVMIRVIGYILLPKLLGNEFEVGLLAVLAITVPLMINALQYWRMPESAPALEKYQNDTSVLSSAHRIFTSKATMGQIIGIALLCGSIWGFGWNQDEIVKVKYLFLEPGDFMATQLYLMPSLGILTTVSLYGLVYSLPEVFNKLSGAKLATLSSILLALSYCVATMAISCDRGQVAGLNTEYVQPNCSSHCNCAAPWSEFKPVCVVDSLTTYISPCHAGCEGNHTVADVMVLRDCACAPADGFKRATFGACNINSCNVSYQMFRMFYYLIITLTVLALQGKGMLLLRTVEPHDRPLAVGIATAISLVVTFCGVHFSYLGIQVTTCAWRERGRCLLQNDLFPIYVGAASAALSGCSALIGIVTWVAQRRSRRNEKADIVASNGTLSAPSNSTPNNNTLTINAAPKNVPPSNGAPSNGTIRMTEA